MNDPDPLPSADSFQAQPCLHGVTAVCPEIRTAMKPTVAVTTQATPVRRNLREFGIAAGMYLGAFLVIAAVRYHKHCEHEAWKTAQLDDIEAAVYRHEIAQFKEKHAYHGTNGLVAFALYPSEAQPRKSAVDRLGDDKQFIANYVTDRQRNEYDPILSFTWRMTWISDGEVYVQGLYHYIRCGRCVSWRVVFRDNQWIVSERN